jgi:uncharacterized protein YbjT (DUF2867 family)
VRVLVTGITGYIGSRLTPRLQRDGHAVRGFSRSGGSALGVPVATGDAVSGAGLDEALAGIDVAYYLIHSMEQSSNGSLIERERTGAERFARAANAAGVRRIVYLGGPVPAEASPMSAHLASRAEVERILLDEIPDSVAFRASIVIGAGSRSFRFLVRLVERLPVLAVPAWRVNRSSPIDERDVIELLARAATSDAVAGMSLDARGVEIVSYGELIERIRDEMLVGRPAIKFKHLTVTPIASRIAALVAGEDHALIGPLMESLDWDLLPRDDRAAELLGVRLHPLDRAIEHSLREWEATEPLAAR